MILKGMTWNHERGVRPLVEASRLFKEKYNIEIMWESRSLSDFELYPLDILANAYDMIMIDHPHIGVAHEEGLLIPLENYFTPEFWEEQKTGSVGQSYDSYTWEGHQYAIPLDAAAQVSASRGDMLSKLNIALPTTWSDVLELPKKLPQGTFMAIPFVPVHAYSSFFTLCSQFSDKLFWTNGEDLNPEVGEKALTLLQKIVAVSHPDSKDMDPINMLDAMSDDEQIVYSPLVYGYSNYSRPNYGNYIVTFNDMPKANTEPCGSMIGGVGLSISSKCSNVEAALKFVEMVSVPEFQRTQINKSDGQPGHIKAWQDKKVNADSNNFFSNTLKTLSLGSLRPRFNGYVDFQGEAGARIRNFVINGNTNYTEFIAELNQLIAHCRTNKGL